MTRAEQQTAEQAAWLKSLEQSSVAQSRVARVGRANQSRVAPFRVEQRPSEQSAAVAQSRAAPSRREQRPSEQSSVSSALQSRVSSQRQIRADQRHLEQTAWFEEPRGRGRNNFRPTLLFTRKKEVCLFFPVVKNMR